MLHHRYYVFMKMQCSMSFKKVSVFTCIFKGALLKGHTFFIVENGLSFGRKRRNSINDMHLCITSVKLQLYYNETESTHLKSYTL